MVGWTIFAAVHTGIAVPAEVPGDQDAMAGGSPREQAAKSAWYAPREFDCGFLATRDTDLHGHARLRILGPFFERRWRPQEATSLTAIRPFFASAFDTNRQMHVQDFLWPVGTIRDRHQARSFRFLLAWGQRDDRTGPDGNVRFMIFPLLFAGRAADGEGYLAVFPVGGRLRDFLGQDKISFVLFPLYVHSSMKTLDSVDILWPVFSRTCGGDVERFRLFPFYGQSVNGHVWKKRFVLWPLWTSVRYDYPQSSGDGFILFPLYGRVKLTDQDTWMLVPPLFRWSVSERLKKVHAPWPVFQYSRGVTDKLYLWPLAGRKIEGNHRHTFALWPLIAVDSLRRRDYEAQRAYALPFFYYESRGNTNSAAGAGKELSLQRLPPDGGVDGADVGDTAGGIPPIAAANEGPAKTLSGSFIPTERYVMLWPLGSYWRSGCEKEFRMLDLWPVKRVAPIERNLAPFWTIYSHKRVGTASEDEFLWGLFRHQRNSSGAVRTSIFPVFSWQHDPSAHSREWSFGLGLAGYRRGAAGAEYRLLYVLKLRRRRAEASNDSEQARMGGASL